MSFLSWISNIGRKLWTGVKGVGSKIYNFGSKIVHGISDAANWVDDKLGGLSKIPILGDLANMIRGSEDYIALKGLIGGARIGWDGLGSVGGAIGAGLDQWANPGKQGLSPVGGGVAPAMPVSAPKPRPGPGIVGPRPPAGLGAQRAY